MQYFVDSSNMPERQNACLQLRHDIGFQKKTGDLIISRVDSMFKGCMQAFYSALGEDRHTQRALLECAKEFIGKLLHIAKTHYQPSTRKYANAVTAFSANTFKTAVFVYGKKLK